MVRQSDFVHKFKLSWFSQPDANHVVQFYADEELLDRYVFEYIIVGLAHNETCIVIASTERLIRLQKFIRTQGIDLAAALGRGQYQAYDAEDLITRLATGKKCSEVNFRQLLANPIASATDHAKPIRVFSEMVAALQRQRDINIVLDLEKKWNELRRIHQFALYCAYPESMRALDCSEERQAIIMKHCNAIYA